MMSLLRFRSRLSLLAGLAIAGMLLVAARLFWVQILAHGAYQTQALEQQVKRRGLPPSRGEILDRNLVPLARTVDGKRFYPQGALACQVLGYVGQDQCGRCGMEYAYDEALRGISGWTTLQKDANGRTFRTVEYTEREAEPGRTLILTLDGRYQEIVQEGLRQTVERFNAAGGTAIVLDPKTGEILALANVPDFDPNRAAAGDSLALQNRAVAHIYEPGSTFKVITASAALEAGLVSPGETFDGENGKTHLGKYTISEAEGEHFGRLTLREAITHSSNVCMLKVGRKVGKVKLYEQARAFGIGCPTGVELPGEVRGRLDRPGDWSEVKLANVSFGQGVAVTPLQMACAYAAVANGGLLLKPRIIKEVIPTDSAAYPDTAIVVRRVIRPATTDSIKSYLMDVVEKGTGIAARLEGIAVAGKTGTAQKSENGKYVPGKHVASFIGFLPAQAPKWVIAVVVDEPRKGSYFGAAVAAPLFHDIAQRILALPVSGRESAPQTPGGALAAR
jgi:cell division protein FtsI/penicillin-binding protein 2